MGKRVFTAMGIHLSKRAQRRRAIKEGAVTKREKSLKFSEVGGKLAKRRDLENLENNKRLPQIVITNFNLDSTKRLAIQTRIIQTAKHYGRNAGRVLLVLSKNETGYAATISWSGRNGENDVKQSDQEVTNSGITLDSAFLGALKSSAAAKHSGNRKKLGRASKARLGSRLAVIDSETSEGSGLFVPLHSRDEGAVNQVKTLWLSGGTLPGLDI